MDASQTDGFSVSGQALGIGETDGGRAELLCSLFGVFLNGNELEKSRTLSPPRARARPLVGSVGWGRRCSRRGLGRPPSDEDRAGVADPGEVCLAVDGEVFGGDAVGQVVGFLQRACDDGEAIICNRSCSNCVTSGAL